MPWNGSLWLIEKRLIKAEQTFRPSTNVPRHPTTGGNSNHRLDDRNIPYHYLPFAEILQAERSWFSSLAITSLLIPTMIYDSQCPVCSVGNVSHLGHLTYIYKMFGESITGIHTNHLNVMNHQLSQSFPATPSLPSSKPDSAP